MSGRAKVVLRVWIGLMLLLAATTALAFAPLGSATAMYETAPWLGRTNRIPTLRMQSMMAVSSAMPVRGPKLYNPRTPYM